MQIEHLLERKPGQLSGGQRQRVALGRAMVRNPRVFLMDEPLTNLDAKLRVQMRAEIAELHRRSGVTFIYVTHDQVEAMTMSDRVAVMMGGESCRSAPPAEIYDRPAELRVAEFIGRPKINVLPGTVRADGGVDVLGGVLPSAAACPPDTIVSVGVRPEHADVVATRRPTASAARSAIAKISAPTSSCMSKPCGEHRIDCQDVRRRSSMPCRRGASG